ncbi:cysteine proteinase [Myriangium duriaei CBS 260.36]|uniref:Cysteine proteinase n=1 Tax=Myriangium duriaei CBS 260.36 TaxID=1168546 RepID=A0A9P4IUJ9_9PEZI|nr:cysteine proteinase [Myriangium duriaei CBS 260.36]
MANLKLTTNPTSKKAESANVKNLLDHAERIKSTNEWKAFMFDLSLPESNKQPSKAEQILLLRASLVNGAKYPPWQAQPAASEFELGSDGKPFKDDFAFKLSYSQSESLAGWEHASKALPPPSWNSVNPATVTTTTDAASVATIDLVQDAATDCSVVASMCAVLARFQKGRKPLLRSVFFPYDNEKGMPEVSRNGKYIARLNFNGTFRRVVIDDTLPVSKTQRLIHVVDRNHPDFIWPALLEKMYLKIYGGYDFPGSNSATDLWVLFGWIPEQIFMGSQSTSLTEIWRRIWDAHSNGHVMITLGTGKMSSATERHVGLVGSHDYAVLDLRQEHGQRLMLVKNPWCNGPTWKGSRTVQSSETPSVPGEDPVSLPRDLLNRDSQLSPGTFWMDIHNISQHFDSIYLNWHPGIFKYREDVHFAWDLDDTKSRGTFIDTPQFILRLRRPEPTWLLLCRHIQGKADTVGFINLSIYDRGGSQVVLKEQPLEGSPFVDSYQTLLHPDDLNAKIAYTIVPDQDGLPDPRHTFSISVFSDSKFDLERAKENFLHTTQVSGSWTEDTAGGNADSRLFSQNPQYNMLVSYPTAVSILLETPDKALPVNIKVCFSSGRVHGLRSRDIVADSNTYRPRCALATKRKLDPGMYTIICSTFEPGQIGTFKLRIDSDIAIPVKPLPMEGAGRLKTKISPVSFGSDEQASAVLLLPQRLTRFVAVVRYQATEEQRSQSQQRQERSMVKLSVVQGGSYQYRDLAVSCEGDFRDALGGVRTEEIDLSPAMAREQDIFLLVERSCHSRSIEEETFSVEFLTDSKDAVQTGDWHEWET